MNEPTITPYRIWDLPTRLFHWTLVLLVLLQFLSGEFELLSMQWHYWLGYATLVLLLFRLMWGVFGSHSARFRGFVRGPLGTARYAAALVSSGAPRHAGHNPLGGWSVLLMLLVLLVQTVTGLFSGDDISEAGPLADHVSVATVRWMTRLHHFNKNILLLLILLHVVAVLLHLLLGRDNLIAAMLSGRKRLPQDPGLRFVGNGFALLLLALATIAVAGLVWWAQGVGG